MNRINLAGLITVAITSVISLGVSQGYFMIDKKINLAQKYNSLVTIARGPTPPPESHQSMVAGINTYASPTPKNVSGSTNYTDIFISTQPPNLSTTELFSTERLKPFIAEHSKQPVINELRLPLPTASIPRINLIKKYIEAPILHGSDILALLTINPEYQAAAAKTVLTNLDTTLTTYKQIGTTPDLKNILEQQAGIIVALHTNLQLFSNNQADTVGGIIAADQLVKLTPLLDENTLILQKALTAPETETSCGLCVSSDELLNNNFNSPSINPLPSSL